MNAITFQISQHAQQT